MKKYPKIAVVAGGTSSERDISLKSGKAVYGALKRERQDAFLIDPDSEFKTKLKNSKADVVFLALHGKFGEDGSIQKILEGINLPYTGSGVHASRLAIDKIASRKVFLKNGLKVPNYKVAKKGMDITDTFGDFETPFVIKPRHEGSSIGLSIVSDRAHADTALSMAFNYGDTAIVEEYIHGREITVGVLDKEALPAIEIVTKHNVYDFNAKYLDEGTKYIVPAPLDKNSYKKAQEIGLKAHKLLGCRDFSRVDMRMDSGGDIYVLEVNTIPGMTERSLLPKAASERGVDFSELCLKLIDLALKRRK